MKTKYQGAGWITVAVVAVVFVATAVAVSFRSFHELEEAATASKHTFEVLNLADDLMSALKDAETGGRGYLLTGDETFLKPYLAVRDSVGGQLIELRQRSSITAAQSSLDAVGPLIDAKLTHLSLSIESYRNQSPAAAQAMVRSGDGQRLMDSIRAEMSRFIRIQEGALVQRNTAFQSDMRRMFTTIIASSVLWIFFATAFVYWVYRQAQQRLNKTEGLQASQYARSLIEASLDPLVTISPEGKITDVNAGSVKVTGVPREKLIGTDFSDYFTAPDKAREGYQQVFAKGFVTDYPLTIRHEDGHLTDVLYNASVYKDVQGNVLGVFAAARDVTERKQAEEALLKAGALQSAIFNSANFSSIATDAKGVIQIFNVGAERMLGYTAAEVMNKITPADISDPEEVITRAKALSVELGTPITPGFEALVFKASRGIEDIYELTYIRKDGSRFPAVVSVTALRDDQDAIIGFLLIGTDNTARKQVEAEQKKLDQRLRDQQFYTRSLIESNIDALIATDPAGIITDVNKQMEVLTGCTRDELIGAPFKNYFTDPERAEAGIKQVLSETKLPNYELTARARDGKETVVSYNATTFYDRDRTLQGVFAAARDVTESKRVDQVLQETNVELGNAKLAAEKANLAKSDFLSSMSHELRTPLNAILGFAQLIESGSPRPTSDQKASIDQILLAGWYLLELINEILDLALIESGKLSLSLESMSLPDVLLDCQAMIEPQVQKSGIRMSFPLLDGPYFANADRTRVKQVLINLLSNAIKYNRVGGSVEVTCSAITAERIRISVRDTGEGLSPEKHAQLFQPFNRLGQEASAEEGTGIGLVVSKRLVELMEGEIGAESTVGVGSVFWIELNSAAAPQLTAGADEPLALFQTHVQPGAALRTLLCVEDNRANMQLVEQLIARRPDIRLLSAGDGTRGITLARIHQPDVILMDINLPGISGIQALKILREDPVTAHIPVLAISANAIPSDIQKGLEAGFFRYLTKPIKVNEFMEALDMALKHAKTESDDAIARAATAMSSGTGTLNAVENGENS